MANLNFTLAIHGGAGTINRKVVSPDHEAAVRKGLQDALQAGSKILEKGGTALDAVEAAVISMEDCEHFNAGRGSVFSHTGQNEMEAAIMNGADLRTGAVIGLTAVKNPIRAARAVMEQTEHVILSGRGAEEFARAARLETRPPEYFFTQRRWDNLQKLLSDTSVKPTEEQKHGTVGAVALDSYGDLAAATSTGGMTNKKWNRIGDCPIIGAGTYANHFCAVSGTGHGEYYIRLALAHRLAAMLEFTGMTLEEAADTVIFKDLTELGGTGGLIAVDRSGNITMPFNTEGMYRGYATPGSSGILLYRET